MHSNEYKQKHVQNSDITTKQFVMVTTAIHLVMVIIYDHHTFEFSDGDTLYHIVCNGDMTTMHTLCKSDIAV